MALIVVALASLLAAVSAAPHHEAGHLGTGHSDARVKLEIFYESLCPDSIKFVKEQLVPLYSNNADLLSHLDLTLVPFGKASWTVGEPGDRVQFTCQHQAAECEGNIAQACALKEIERSVEPKDRQAKAVGLVGCAMADRTPNTAVPKCAAKMGLSQESIARIESCSNSAEGDQLLMALGEKTYAFEKPIQNVPSVSINGRKNLDARYKLRQIICSLLLDREHHPSCQA